MIEYKIWSVPGATNLYHSAVYGRRRSNC